MTAVFVSCPRDCLAVRGNYSGTYLNGHASKDIIVYKSLEIKIMSQMINSSADLTCQLKKKNDSPVRYWRARQNKGYAKICYLTRHRTTWLIELPAKLRRLRIGTCLHCTVISRRQKIILYRSIAAIVAVLKYSISATKGLPLKSGACEPTRYVYIQRQYKEQMRC